MERKDTEHVETRPTTCLYHAVVSIDAPPSAAEVVGLDNEIRALRALLDRALAQRVKTGDGISLTEVDPVSRIMTRLATLVAVHRRTNGATSEQLYVDVRATLQALGEQVGVELV